MYTLDILRPSFYSCRRTQIPRSHCNCKPVLKDKIIEAVAIQQLECFKAGVAFAKAEGILPAPEATHGIAGSIQTGRGKQSEKVNLEQSF